VTIIHRREEVRASKIMIDRAKANPKIKWELNHEVAEILTSPRPPFNRDALSGLKLKNTQNGQTKEIAVEGFFIAIGHQPNTNLVEGILPLDSKGYVVTKGQSSKTELPGVFACGDVQDSIYRQAITAAGSGCMAAIDCERFLEHEGH
jgi:thioredoxin reductase (NADPH)